MTLDLDSLSRAVTALEAALALGDDPSFAATRGEVERNVYRAGVIQYFEFTYELCWKFMKRWIENNVSASVVDGVPRRELFRWAAENHLIDDVDRWMKYHAARNITVHTYEPKIAESVFAVTHDLARDARRLLESLAVRNA